MTIRFDIEQGSSVYYPNAFVCIEVDPSKLSRGQRTLIEDRLDGIDVHRLIYEPHIGKKQVFERIKAKLPTLESLTEAMRENEQDLAPFLPKAKDIKGKS